MLKGFSLDSLSNFKLNHDKLLVRILDYLYNLEFSPIS